MFLLRPIFISRWPFINSSNQINEAKMSYRYQVHTVQNEAQSRFVPLQVPDQKIEINVGGKYYTTTLETLKGDRRSFLATMFNGSVRISRDSENRPFIDRDGILFAHILDYLRSGQLLLPEGFNEIERLEQEARYFKLSGLLRDLKTFTSKQLIGKTVYKQANLIMISIRGTFAFGAREVVDVAFRKTPRILVAGHAGLCKSVFKETLNDSRDPHLEASGYTCRFFLTHSNLHNAFEQLYDNGFHLVSCNAGKTNDEKSAGTKRSEEDKWSHFENFVFCRSDSNE